MAVSEKLNFIEAGKNFTKDLSCSNFSNVFVETKFLPFLLKCRFDFFNLDLLGYVSDSKKLKNYILYLKLKCQT